MCAWQWPARKWASAASPSPSLHSIFQTRWCSLSQTSIIPYASIHGFLLVFELYICAHARLWQDSIASFMVYRNPTTSEVQASLLWGSCWHWWWWLDVCSGAQRTGCARQGPHAWWHRRHSWLAGSSQGMLCPIRPACTSWLCTDQDAWTLVLWHHILHWKPQHTLENWDQRSQEVSSKMKSQQWLFLLKHTKTNKSRTVCEDCNMYIYIYIYIHSIYIYTYQKTYT